MTAIRLQPFYAGRINNLSTEILQTDLPGYLPLLTIIFGMRIPGA
jgi:hypothetical protein